MMNGKRIGGPRTTVSINGFALRIIRQRSGLPSSALASETKCSDSYIRLIETGHRTRVSEEFFARVRRALDLENEDRRVLLASPHDAASDGSPESS